MSTPPPPAATELRGFAHAMLVREYLITRIKCELDYGELERYHREDCLVVDPSGYFDLDSCDCDGEERLRDYLRAILAAASGLLLSRETDRRLLFALAAPWQTRPDFPTL